MSLGFCPAFVAIYRLLDSNTLEEYWGFSEWSPSMTSESRSQPVYIYIQKDDRGFWTLLSFLVSQINCMNVRFTMWFLLYSHHSQRTILALLYRSVICGFLWFGGAVEGVSNSYNWWPCVSLVKRMILLFFGPEGTASNSHHCDGYWF